MQRPRAGSRLLLPLCRHLPPCRHLQRWLLRKQCRQTKLQHQPLQCLLRRQLWRPRRLHAQCRPQKTRRGMTGGWTFSWRRRTVRFEEQSQPPLRLLLWLFVRPPLWWLLLLQRVTTWLPSAFPPSQHHPSGQSDSAKIRSRRCPRIGRISLCLALGRPRRRGQQSALLGRRQQSVLLGRCHARRGVAPRFHPNSPDLTVSVNTTCRRTHRGIPCRGAPK